LPASASARGALDHRTVMLLRSPILCTGWVNVRCAGCSLIVGAACHPRARCQGAALGEYHYGAGRGERDMVYIVVGTGVGSALILAWGAATAGATFRRRGGSHHHPREGTAVPAAMWDASSRLCGPAIARAYRRALAERASRNGQSQSSRITAENVVARARGGESLRSRFCRCRPALAQP